MKKRVKQITIAVLAFYIAVPLLILGANVLKSNNEQRALKQILREANLDNAKIKTLSITGADVNPKQLNVTNDTKREENLFTLYYHIIEDIHREGETLHIELKRHPRYNAQKCYFFDAIYIKTLEKVLLNGEEWTDGPIFVEPKDQGGPVIQKR